MQQLVLSLLLLISSELLALPQCAQPYRGTRHDAEWAAINLAFHEAFEAVRGVPFNLALAVGIVESGLRQEALSVTGAVGIMQIMPEAEEHIHVIQRRIGGPVALATNKHNITRFKMSTNVLLGIRYLELALQEAGTLEGALVFYNGGYRQLTKFQNGEKVITETAQYVLRVLQLYGECSK